MKKPRGRTGFARATGARELSFPEANFPRTKADIETWIVKCFFSSLKENGWEPFCLANPRQNEEQDFDYTVDSARGEGFLELVEAGPVEVYRGDYAKAPLVTKSSDVVKNLLEKIKNKSEKYPEDRKYPLYLLIYTTQWNFALSDAQVCWLQYELRREPPKFDGIFSCHPIEENFGQLHWLYPIPPDALTGFDPQQMKDHVVLHLDYRNFKIETNM